MDQFSKLCQNMFIKHQFLESLRQIKVVWHNTDSCKSSGHKLCHQYQVWSWEPQNHSPQTNLVRKQKLGILFQEILWDHIQQETFNIFYGKSKQMGEEKRHFFRWIKMTKACKERDQISRTEQGHTRVPSMSFHFDLITIPS